jgi:hypothetical protein
LIVKTSRESHFAIKRKSQDIKINVFETIKKKKKKRKKKKKVLLYKNL